MNLLKKEVNCFAKHDDQESEEGFVCILDSNHGNTMDVDIKSESGRKSVASTLASCFPERRRKILIDDQFVSPYQRVISEC